MENLIRWFVNNKVVSNLLMILIIITGATTIPMLKMEVFPEIDLNIINDYILQEVPNLDIFHLSELTPVYTPKIKENKCI